MKNSLEKNCEKESSGVCQEKDKDYSENKDNYKDNKIEEPGLLYHLLDYFTRLF